MTELREIEIAYWVEMERFKKLREKFDKLLDNLGDWMTDECNIPGYLSYERCKERQRILRLITNLKKRRDFGPYDKSILDILKQKIEGDEWWNVHIVNK